MVITNTAGAHATDDAMSLTTWPEAPRRSRWPAFGTRIDVTSERGRETLALGVSAIASVVVALITLVAFRLQPVPITGEGSIGAYSAVASAFVAAAAFAVGRYVVPLPDTTLGGCASYR